MLGVPSLFIFFLSFFFLFSFSFSGRRTRLDGFSAKRREGLHVWVGEGGLGGWKVVVEYPVFEHMGFWR